MSFANRSVGYLIKTLLVSIINVVVQNEEKISDMHYDYCKFYFPFFLSDFFFFPFIYLFFIFILSRVNE